MSTAKRAVLLPNVPTTAEAGLKDSGYAFWNGLFLPAKTPREIVDKLHDETQKALDLPELQEKLAKTGTDPLPMSTDEFEKYFRDDVRATAELAKKAGIEKVE